MALSMAAADAALKVLHVGQKFQVFCYKDRPFYGMINKHPNFYGKNMPLPFKYAHAQGRSASIGDALSLGASGAGKYEDFILTRAKNYAVVTIDNETMESAESDLGAWVSLRKSELDGGFEVLLNDICVDLYGEGDGVRGQVADLGDGSATPTITLTNVDDVVKFEVGMFICASDTRTGTLKNPTAGVNFEITAIDRRTGKLTLDGDIDTGGTVWEVDDFLFQQGDAANGGTIKKMTGAAGWLSDSDTPAALFGVTRTTDRTRLAGLYYDGSSKTIIDALYDATAFARREGAHGIRHAFCNPVHFAEIVKALDGKATYEPVKTPDGVFGYEALVLRTPSGRIALLEDMWCPPGVIYCLDLSTWGLYSLKGAPRYIGGDGLSVLRQSDADGVEARMGYYAQVGCNSPGSNLRVKVATE